MTERRPHVALSAARTEDHVPPAREARDPARASLVVAFPESGSLPVPLPGEPVGRDWLARFGVPDTRVSTAHLLFTRPGGGLFLEDAGSRNGTWVNGARLQQGERASLGDGAVIRVGRTLLVYREDVVGEDAPSAAVGRLVGPYGLRRVHAAVAAIAARRPSNVLIEGETGTGKELVARAVAEAAGRAHRYAPVNVAGVAPGVFESQLFGYVPGAYSGSGRGSPGIFGAHDGGAVFLDEIGELTLELQAKLLRVLDNREVLPVGAVRPITVDVLIISATNRALEECVAAGTFRRDLLARLSASKIDLPPLRERAEDLFALTRALLAGRGETLDATEVEVEAMELLMLHDWPSNVREVASVLERVAVLGGRSELRLASVERVLGRSSESGIPSGSGLTLAQVHAALEAAGSETAAAKRLGVSRGKLRRFLEAHAGK